MTDLRKAAEDLLEVVEAAIKAGDWKVDGACDQDSAIVRLRQALAQPEQGNNSPNYPNTEPNTSFVDAVNMRQERVDETEKREHEPVAWFIQYEHRHEFLWRKPNELEQKTALEIKPLYTAPPKREWVGLTDEEIEECKINGGLPHAINWRLSVKVMEAKLKEKNT